jgi:hypothetical protein
MMTFNLVEAQEREWRMWRYKDILFIRFVYHYMDQEIPGRSNPISCSFNVLARFPKRMRVRTLSPGLSCSLKEIAGRPGLPS